MEIYEIAISDNGCGIPEHVIGHLGQPGFTFGKKLEGSGNGLGIYQAKQTIEEIGGSIQITSTRDKGTCVRLFIPAAKPPTWFVGELNLSEISTIVSVDDDPSIHHVWKTRLGALETTGLDIRHLTFMELQAFEKWLVIGKSELILRECSFLSTLSFQAVRRRARIYSSS